MPLSKYLLIAMLLSLFPAISRAEQGKLTRQDRELLDSFFDNYLFDPDNQNAELMIVDSPAYFRADEKLQVWRQKNEKTGQYEYYTSDGFQVPVDPKKQASRFDVAKMSRTFLALKRPANDLLDDWISEHSAKHFGNVESLYVVACWLYKLKEEELAVKMLELAKDFGALKKKTCKLNSVGRAKEYIKFLFKTKDDEITLTNSIRFVKIYPPEDYLDTGIIHTIGLDLLRRRRYGSFGKAETSLPEGFANWSKEKKLKHLISSLQDVGLSSSESRRVSWADFRTYSLLELDRDAVPALIEVCKNDKRLTRLQLPLKNCIEDREGFYSVSWIAENILELILTTSTFARPRTQTEEPVNGQKGKLIEKFWQNYGQLTLRDRCMKILQDDKLDSHCHVEAAEILVSGHFDGVMVNGQLFFDSTNKWTRHSSREEFQNPTVAEAIVQAMIRDCEFEARKNPENSVSFVLTNYLDTLVKLKDSNVAHSLEKLAQSSKFTRDKYLIAEATHRLGSPKLLIQFLRDFENRGSFRFNQASIRSMESVALIEKMTTFGTTEVEKALLSLCDRMHPENAALRNDFYKEGTRYLFRCSIWLPLMAQNLSNTLVTESTLKLKDTRDELVDEDPDSTFKEIATQRECDLAARVISKQVFGFPFYSPFLENAEDRFEKIKTLTVLHRKRIRKMNSIESEKLADHSLEKPFIVDIKPLDRPATSEDVKKGDAIFFLNEKTTRSSDPLPAFVLLKKEAKKETPQYGLIVQAEIGADGKKHYGVIFRRDIRKVTQDEVLRIEPYQAEKQSR